MSINPETNQYPLVFGRPLRRAGRFVRLVSVWDEEWLEGEPVVEPSAFIREVRAQKLGDVFTFSRALPALEAIPGLPSVMENAAVVPCASFSAWWESLPQEARKNVRRSERRGVVTRLTSFDDDLVRGITAIYNEVPIRQGRKFWHYGKAFDQVKRENATYLERSVFIGSYLGDELIGFVKFVDVNRVGRIMQILALDRHNDKRPMNALIARAVEVCCERQFSHFVYGQYVYGNKENSPMTEFKRRNGFQRLDYPRYHVPLTSLGAIAVRTGIHRGFSHLLPESVLNPILKWRAAFYSRKFATRPEQKALT